jgi:glycosyltransferase involved in cell wall biosynthesis
VVGPGAPGVATRALRRARGRGPLDSDGFLESLGVDVVHFPYQSYVECALPTVYNPHDLQHRHFPEFFEPEQLAWRERVQGTALGRADAVAAESRWTADDVIREYGVDPARVHVLPRGAPTALFDVDEAALESLDLPSPFVLYPAASWPHKNHLRLVEALAELASRGVPLSLVCTGARTPHWNEVERRVGELGLGERVRHLGFVEPGALRALYRRAELAIVPSLFEGGGFPVLEAFAEGTPVACADATALPEVAGDGALLFDPTSPTAIADALARLHRSEPLREELRHRGAERIRRHDWADTAGAYADLYRRVASS